jgi:PGF-CTERM protein
MVSKKLFSAVLATLVILSIVGPTVAFAQTNMGTANVTANVTANATANATQNVTKGAVKSAVASATAAGGFLGLPGFEALYAVAGLLIVAFLVMLRRK